MELMRKEIVFHGDELLTFWEQITNKVFVSVKTVDLPFSRHSTAV